MSEKTKKVKVLELIQDWKIWPRHEAGKLDSTNVSKLREILESGRNFNTPIVADSKSLRLIDGFHRTRALLDVFGDDAETEVLLRDYADEVAMRIDAARYANSGSLQLTPKDKVHFALGMRRDHVPWPLIADALDMDMERVRKLVEGRSVMTQDGTKIAVSAAVAPLAEHLAGRPANSDQEHFARTANGSPPMMHARMLLNALRARGAISHDEQTVNVLRELAGVIAELLSKVRVPDMKNPTFTPEQMESIRIFTRCYYDYQEERKALDGQLGMTKAGEAKKGRPARDSAMLMTLSLRRDDILKLEESMEKDVAKLIHNHPLWIHFLRDVKGVGEMMTAVMVTQFDIDKAETVSKMWQFSGTNPGQVHGKVWKGKNEKRTLVATEEMIRGDKKAKGFVCPFNSFLKAKLLGVLGPSFLKCNSPYRTYYDNMKHRVESKDWGTVSKNQPTLCGRRPAISTRRPTATWSRLFFVICMWHGVPLRACRYDRRIRRNISERPITNRGAERESSHLRKPAGWSGPSP